MASRELVGDGRLQPAANVAQVIGNYCWMTRNLGERARFAGALTEAHCVGQHPIVAGKLQFLHHDCRSAATFCRAMLFAGLAGAMKRRRCPCGALRSRRDRTCSRTSEWAAAFQCRDVMQMAVKERGQESQNLPNPDLCWVLVTGATAPVSRRLARLCCERGFGVIVSDGGHCQSELAIIVAEMRSVQERFGPAAHRVYAAVADLQSSNGLEVLHASIKSWGCDVAVLIAGHQMDGTDCIFQQPCEDLYKMISVNVTATAGLCRLFAADMKVHGGGRILVTSTAVESAGVLALLTKSLVTGLEGELASAGVSISLLHQPAGSSIDLCEALQPTCLGFMVDPGMATPLRRVDGPDTALEAGSDDAIVGSGSGVPSSSVVELEDEYALLARERDFPVLPFAREIHEWQKLPSVEIINASLVGLACATFAIKTLPGFEDSQLIAYIEDTTAALFSLDYFLRWYSRGLRFDYLLTQVMVVDALAIFPFFLEPFVPAFSNTTLNFLRLLRTVRLYRLFRPRRFKEVAKDFFGVDTNVTSYQLTLVRSFGIVFTLIFIVAGLEYTVEHEVNKQLSDFFSALYFSIISLSTVGFGDISPVTPAGRLILSLSIPAGLIIVPFQATEIANAFAEEQRLKEMKSINRQAENNEKMKNLLATLEGERGTAIAGRARAELEALQKKRESMKTLQDLFVKFDVDGSGAIDFAEFVLLAEEVGIE